MHDIIDDERQHIRAMPRQHTLSRNGLAMLKVSEAFRAETYDDLRPGRPYVDGPVIGTLTIGYGHTGQEAMPGNRISERTAEDLLAADLVGFERAIKALVKVRLTQGEYDALVSFVYNVGEGNFERSTLLRRLNAGDYDGAAGEFPRWVYSKGGRLGGLEDRRTAEQAMFQGQTGIVTLLAERGERAMGVGSNVCPDCEVGGGLMKPLRKSKTSWLSGLGLGGMGISGLSYVLDGLGRMDPKVVMFLGALAFAAILIVRWRESRVGEH